MTMSDSSYRSESIADAAASTRGFLPLLTARLTSVAGAGVYFIATAWLLISHGAGSGGLAGLGVAMVAPGLLFALQGGVVIDRYSRRRVGQTAELIRALSVAVMAVSKSAGHLPNWEIYAVTAVLGLGTAVTVPCYGAMLPEVLPRHRLVRGNAVWQIATQVGAISASGFGGVLVGAGSAVAGLWTAACCCLAAACALQFIPAGHPSGAREQAQFLRALAHAAAMLSKDRTTMWVTIFCVLPPSALATANILLPVFCRQRLGTGATGFGVIEAVWGVGAMASGMAISRWAVRIRREHRSLVTSLLMSGAAMAAFSLITNYAGSVAAAIALGFALSCSGVLFPAFVQSHTPEVILGRVLSGIQFSSSAVQLVFYITLWSVGNTVPSWTLFLSMGVIMTASAPLLALLLTSSCSSDSAARPVDILD
jgi:MFS family permease